MADDCASQIGRLIHIMTLQAQIFPLLAFLLLGPNALEPGDSGINALGGVLNLWEVRTNGSCRRSGR